MGFAVLMYIDRFNMIKTYNFIIYILEYIGGKASFCYFLENATGFSIPSKTHEYLIQGDL